MSSLQEFRLRYKELKSLIMIALSGGIINTAQKWTDVPAGTALSPTEEQNCLSCDSTGAVQSVISLFATPADGQIQIIRLTGAGNVMPVVVNAQGAGITVESVVTPGAFGASTFLAISNMIAAYKFDLATNRWKLTSLTQGSQSATAQTTWNVSYATGQASGDGVTIPVSSAAEIYRRWQGGIAGTVPILPTITINVIVLDGTAAFTDPFCVLFNVLGTDTSLIIKSNSSTLVHAGTLTTASAFARTSAGGQITITDAGVPDWHAFAPLPLLFVDTTVVGQSVGVLYEPFSGANANGIISPNRPPQVPGVFSQGTLKTVSNGDNYQLLRLPSIYMGTGSTPRNFPRDPSGGSGLQLFVYRLHLTAQNEFETMSLCNDDDADIATFVELQECIYDPIGIMQGVTAISSWSTSGIGLEATLANGFELFAGGTYGGLFIQSASGFIGGDFVFDPTAGGFGEVITNARGLQNNLRIGTMSFWGGTTAVPNTSGYFQFRIGGPITDPVAVFYGKVGGGNPIFICAINNLFQLTGGAQVAMQFDSSTFTISGFTSGYAFNPATGLYVGPTTFTLAHVDAAIGAGTGFGGFALAPQLGSSGVTTQNG